MILFSVSQVVQEYERAVIFRLGRLTAGEKFYIQYRALYAI